MLPTRVGAWAGFWGKFHTTGSAPYLAGETNPDGTGGYWLDGDDHYDPIFVYYMVQDWCIRNGLPIVDWGDQIAAGVTRFRDRAVRAPGNPGPPGGQETPGVQEYHRYATGIVRHHFESSDPVELANNIEAMGYLDKRDFPSYLQNYGHPGVYREAAFILNTLMDWELMGLGVHPNINDAIEVCIHQNVYTAVQGPTRRWGISIKPFMVGINNWALSRAWERHRNSSDPTRAALCAQIPDNIKGICQYMWDVCWFPPGVPVPYEGGTWSHGAISYKDLALDDIMFTRMFNLDMTSVSNRWTFRGPASLSTTDDYYNENKIELNHPITGKVADQWLVGDYVGSTREFTISESYRPNFDYDDSWTFNLIPAAWKSFEEDGDRGAAPAMNPMAMFGFAFTYWHQKRVALDDTAAAIWRGRAHDIFNGSEQAWDYPYNSKLMHQGTFLAIPAMDYLARGDEEWPIATFFNLDAPSAGAAGDAGVASGPFRISIPYGTRLEGPEAITPAADDGVFSEPAPILSNDLRMAMFTFTPDISQDGSTVPVGAFGETLDPDGSISYVVGDEGEIPPDPDPDPDPPPDPVRLIPAIMEYVRLDTETPVRRGSPHVEDYPVILVDRLRDATRVGTEALTGVSEEEFYFQVTVAALDPGTAESLGEAIRDKLRNGPTIRWGAGRAGREVTRYETDSRERYQVGAAPGARTIYYYETDMILVIQRGGID